MSMFRAHRASADSWVPFYYSSQAVGQLRVRHLLDCDYLHDSLKYTLGILQPARVRRLGQKTTLANENPV